MAEDDGLESAVPEGAGALTLTGAVGTGTGVGEEALRKRKSAIPPAMINAAVMRSAPRWLLGGSGGGKGSTSAAFFLKGNAALSSGRSGRSMTTVSRGLMGFLGGGAAMSVATPSSAIERPANAESRPTSIASLLLSVTMLRVFDGTPAAPLTGALGGAASLPSTSRSDGGGPLSGRS